MSVSFVYCDILWRLVRDVRTEYKIYLTARRSGSHWRRTVTLCRLVARSLTVFSVDLKIYYMKTMMVAMSSRPLTIHSQVMMHTCFMLVAPFIGCILHGTRVIERGIVGQFLAIHCMLLILNVWECSTYEFRVPPSWRIEEKRLL